MAKKTFGDVLKSLLGSKLDEEIDIDDSVLSQANKEDQVDKDKPTEEEKSKVDGKVNDNDTETEDTSEENTGDNKKSEETKEEEVVSTKIFEDDWFDETSGNVNFDKIKSEEVVVALRLITDKYRAEKEQRMISDCLNDTLKDYSLNVSEDTLRKVLDTSGVKIDKDGKVVGVKEAIENLRNAEPGFFKDKEKESSPLNEGFNPVEKQSTLTEDEIINLAYGQDE